jgi:hypothetical protein
VVAFCGRRKPIQAMYPDTVGCCIIGWQASGQASGNIREKGTRALPLP